MKEELSIPTPIGTIKAIGNSSSNFPSIWIEVDGEPVAHVEYDLSVGKHVIRVYDYNDPESEDYIYKQTLEKTKVE